MLLVGAPLLEGKLLEADAEHLAEVGEVGHDDLLSTLALFRIALTVAFRGGCGFGDLASLAGDDLVPIIFGLGSCLLGGLGLVASELGSRGHVDGVQKHPVPLGELFERHATRSGDEVEVLALGLDVQRQVEVENRETGRNPVKEPALRNRVGCVLTQAILEERRSQGELLHGSGEKPFHELLASGDDDLLDPVVDLEALEKGLRAFNGHHEIREVRESLDDVLLTDQILLLHVNSQ